MISLFDYLFLLGRIAVIKTNNQTMKSSIIKYLNLTCWIGFSAAVTAFAEPTPAPSPTSTPHTEPSASPTPSGTPRTEPTPTPTPTATPGDDHDGVSLRGVYGATTPSGGLIVFCIEKNKIRPHRKR